MLLPDPDLPDIDTEEPSLISKLIFLRIISSNSDVLFPLIIFLTNLPSIIEIIYIPISPFLLEYIATSKPFGEGDGAIL